MTSKIGFFKSNLQDTFPRGARRAARAIVEIIDATSQYDQNLICLDEKKIPNSRPLSFFFDPLNDWLKSNPLYLPKNADYAISLGGIKNLSDCAYLRFLSIHQSNSASNTNIHT